MRRFPITASFFLIFFAGIDAAAQSASPFVPHDHWAVEAVDRLHARGLAPAGTGRGQQSRTIAEVRRVFEHAAESGDATAASWLRRFLNEFDTSERPVLTHASAAAGVARRAGDVAPGLYTDWGEEYWTGARPRPDRTAAAGRIALLGSANFLAAGAIASADAQHSRIDELYGTTQLGWLGVWGGRRTQGFTPGTSGVVLNAGAPFDGGGVFLAEPLLLPWLLRHLGPVRAEFAAGVLDPNGPVEQPWFVLTRGTIEPHPRVGIGVTRGGMIGPDDGARGVADVLFFLVGGHTGGSEYDNQVVSVDAWLRADVAALPLLFHVEWGAEDSSGAWWRVPAIIAGIEVPALPGLDWLALGIERATFTRSSSGNPPWYRHPIGLHEGWTTRGELFGHPLGGHGRELLGHARATLFDARLQLGARGFTRVRGSENLYAPERTGRSNGFALDLSAQILNWATLQFAGSTEDGRSWRRTTLTGMLQVHLPH